MPEFVFTGPYAVTPEGRDAGNLPFGLVEPGDVRDLDAPIDGNWLPVEGNEDHPLLQDREDGGGQDEDPSANGDGGRDASSPATPPPAVTPALAGPQPAPPAVIPVTTQEG